MLRLIFLGTLVLVGILSGQRFARASEDNVVHIVSWGGKFQSDLMSSWVAPAAKRSGLILQTDSWDGDYGALTRRVSIGLNTWDLVHVESYYVMTPGHDQLFRSFPKRSLPTISATYLNDPLLVTILNEGYAAPVLEYAYIAATREDLLPQNAKQTSYGWKEFWDLKRLPGHRGLRDFPIGNLEAALVSLGHSPQSYLYDPTLAKDVIQHRVQEALDRLHELRGYIVWWKTGDQLEASLDSGDMVFAGAWSGRLLSVHRELCKTVTVAQCRLKTALDSALISTDWWVIPANTTRGEAADKLVKALFSREAVDGAKQFSERQGYTAPINDKISADPVAQFYLNAGSSGNTQAVARIDERFWSANFDWINEEWQSWRLANQ